MLRITLTVASLLLLGVNDASLAQDTPPWPLFADDAVLDITLEGPFTTLRRDTREGREWRASTLRYTDTDGAEVVLDVGIRVRGRSRLAYCAYPPLGINLKRGQVPDTIFAGQNRLKLVTRCRDTSTYESYLAQEYQVYKAFNALTDKSYRVRWLNIHYVDTASRQSNSYTHSGFLIEEEAEVAERNGMELIETPELHVEELDAAATALSSLFHFMIGNTDWSGTSAPAGEDCCHNGVPIGVPGSETGRIVLPYDFDAAGVINTSYAHPSEGLPISEVSQRLYRGYCATNEELESARELLNERRDEVVGVFSSDGASRRAKNRAVNYIERSYEMINDPRRWEREILGRCRG